MHRHQINHVLAFSARPTVKKFTLQRNPSKYYTSRIFIVLMKQEKRESITVITTKLKLESLNCIASYPSVHNSMGMSKASATSGRLLYHFR